MQSTTLFSLPASRRFKVFYLFKAHLHTHKKPVLMLFPPFSLIFNSGEHLQIPSHGHQQEFCLMNEQKRN